MSLLTSSTDRCWDGARRRELAACRVFRAPTPGTPAPLRSSAVDMSSSSHLSLEVASGPEPRGVQTMSDLVVRHIPFEFDGVEFIWNPANPQFALAMNILSFWAIGLERYLVKTMKDADAVITDAEVRQEARLFLQQESVHTSCHRRHVKALIEWYPGFTGRTGQVDRVLRRTAPRRRSALPAGLRCRTRGNVHPDLQDDHRQPGHPVRRR